MNGTPIEQRRIELGRIRLRVKLRDYAQSMPQLSLSLSLYVLSTTIFNKCLHLRQYRLLHKDYINLLCIVLIFRESNNLALYVTSDAA